MGLTTSGTEVVWLFSSTNVLPTRANLRGGFWLPGRREEKKREKEGFSATVADRVSQAAAHEDDRLTCTVEAGRQCRRRHQRVLDEEERWQAALRSF